MSKYLPTLTKTGRPRMQSKFVLPLANGEEVDVKVVGVLEGSRDGMYGVVGIMLKFLDDEGGRSGWLEWPLQLEDGTRVT